MSRILNADPYGKIALQGYDPVAFHTDGKALKGNPGILAENSGYKLAFASEENKALFEKQPGKYLPAFGGYCAFGVSVGKKFIGDPEVWRVVDGRLYLNLDTGIQDEWLKDVPGRIKKANTNWKKIRDKSPASL